MQIIPLKILLQKQYKDIKWNLINEQMDAVSVPCDPDSEKEIRLCKSYLFL
jgi:hypothetical protein